MSQLRQDYAEYKNRNAVILIDGLETASAFARYFGGNSLPFTGLLDPNHSVLKTYGQVIKLFKFGRMLAQDLVDRIRTARFVHYGHDMTDIPQNSDMLALIDELNS